MKGTTYENQCILRSIFKDTLPLIGMDPGGTVTDDGQHKVYYEGRLILEAGMEYLSKTEKISDADQVIISGESAGGLTV